uniref:PDZ and LIM domain protein 7 n=1 Tax=Hadrurus spadix TaxID=141984 RepID=A0A1W7R9Z9_9SCOR
MERPLFYKLPKGIQQDYEVNGQVFLGSPSEGELQRGDVILQVGKKDGMKLTHMEAHDVIKNSGNNLDLVVQRSAGYMSPGFTPTTPPLKSMGHPLANVRPLPSSKPGTPTTPKLFQPVAPLPSCQPRPAWMKQSNYIPPPTAAKIPTFVPTPQTFAELETQEYHQEQKREQQAITKQAYRTFPLIAPGAKPRHDLPTGSYLRHVQDPNWIKQPSRASPITRVVMNTPSAASESGPQVVHSQYNSPINIYSQQNVAETYAEQTGLQPRLFRPGGGKSSPQPPLATQQSKKPGEKITNIVDITKSPTYMLIQEEEGKKSPNPEMEEPRQITQKRVYVHPMPCSQEMNAFGMPRDKILQSGTFKSLMTVVNTQSDF